MSQNLNSLAPEFMNKHSRNVENHLSPDDYKRWCHKKAEIEKCNKQKIDCLECEKPCDDPCANESFGFGWLGILILWFIIFTVMFWLIFYSLNPSWSQNQDGTVNTGKVLLAAIIAAIVLVIIIWLIKSCIEYSY
jgi:hypothetical protein